MYLQFIDQNQGVQKSIYNHETCLAIAIKNDNSMLLTGWDNKVLVHIFKQGKLKQLKFLHQHQAKISTLNFCSKSSNIISGSLDGSIIIQSISLISKSKWIQKLKGHVDIICLAISPLSEDLIVTGSRDNSIKFWQCINKQFSCSQTILDHNNCVCGLSINELEDTVISCSLDQLIIIFEQVKNNKYVNWVVKQKILVDQFGYCIRFINKNIFVFQPQLINDSKLIIYTLNDQKLFIKSSQLSINDGGTLYFNYFPLLYNIKKNILIYKINNNVNVIRVIKQDKEEEFVEFKLEQIIEFEDYQIFGTLSNDGEYLVTWNEISKQIQIRKYQQIG
ncbi:unnamed protein product [Paramecium primaurelia]|uniref:Uncharacterized protein n=1 Tax=Paramecium primaurelia TaxID=5886 RepID=A0A8S1LYS2_PARPR|nr:unnamed protein product [Paramecium primaurelia]